MNKLYQISPIANSQRVNGDRSTSPDAGSSAALLNQTLAILGTMLGLIGTVIGWYNSHIAATQERTIQAQEQQIEHFKAETDAAGIIATYIPLITNKERPDIAVSAAYSLKDVVDNPDLYVRIIQATRNDSLHDVLTYYCKISPEIKDAVAQTATFKEGTPEAPSSKPQSILVQNANATLSQLVTSEPGTQGWSYLASRWGNRWEEGTQKMMCIDAQRNRTSVTLLDTPDKLIGRDLVVVDDVYLRTSPPTTGYDGLPSETIIGILTNETKINVQKFLVVTDHTNNPAVWVWGKVTSPTAKELASTKR